MNKKGWFLGGIGIFLIVVGVIFHFVFSITEEKKENQDKEAQIVEKYAPFRSAVETFSTRREQLFSTVMNNLFVEEVESSYQDWIKEFSSYQQIVDKIEEASEDLKKLCIGSFYDHTDVNNKCNAFVISYETSLNYFVKDVETLNHFLDTYTKSVVESSKIKVEQFIAKYNYTDLNDDGKYSGKES